MLGFCMVNREVVLETIKKMHESGIEQSVIEATLKDIGLNEAEVKQYLGEVSGKPAPMEKEQDDKIASKAAEKIKGHLVEERQERELRETTQQNEMQEHGSKLKDIDKKVETIRQKFDGGSGSAPINEQITVLEHRINGLEKKLGEIKAISNATKIVMEKVLEANRKILNKL